MKTLGGVLFIRNGEQFDYCYRQAIDCLYQLCDKVVILDAGSDDGTADILKEYECENIMVICLGEEEWGKQQGREKLSYFQNLALAFLDTDYYFLLQGDEIIHQDSFSFIREAIETGEDGIVCKRINLWRDCNSYINVPENRQPCSTHVIRLAKTNFKSVGDGESISANAISKYVNNIRIYHYGFVRKKEVMRGKVINMQKNVFQLSNYDPKLDQSEIFNSELWFSGEELSPITEEHPTFIKEWIKKRP